jgi:hypothetical protein
MGSELKNALDVVRQETERQAGQHLTLSVSIKKELEGPVSEFASKQANHKKNVGLVGAYIRSVLTSS